MAANAEINEVGIHRDGQFSQASKNMSQAVNGQYGYQTLDTNMFRKPEKYYYIYSVADRELVRTLAPAIKLVTIRPRPEKKVGSYSYCRAVPHPFPQGEKNQDGADVVYYSNGLGIVMDIICPGHVTGNLDEIIDKKNVFQQNNDFARLGVFYSMRSPEDGGPLPEEIAAAEARRDNTYRKLLMEARSAEASNPASLYGNSQVPGILTPDHHNAAEWFGEVTSWHKSYKPYVDQAPVVVTTAVSNPDDLELCSNCGGSMKKGAAWHIDPSSEVCVLDWKRTVASGKKKKSDVPEEARWWSEHKEA